MDNTAKQIERRLSNSWHSARSHRRIWNICETQERGEWFASGPMPTKWAKARDALQASELSRTQSRRRKRWRNDRNGHVSRNTLLAYERPHRLVSPSPEKGIPIEVEFRLDPEGDPKDNKVASL